MKFKLFDKNINQYVDGSVTQDGRPFQQNGSGGIIYRDDLEIICDLVETQKDIISTQKSIIENLENAILELKKAI